MKVTTSKGRTHIKPEGELTVSRAAEFKDVLVDSLEKSEAVVVNLDEIERIDLACLQLLCSAHRTASRKGKALTVKEPAPSPYLEARRDAGFMYSKQCRHVTTEDCLWVGGEEQ